MQDQTLLAGANNTELLRQLALCVLWGVPCAGIKSRVPEVEEALINGVAFGSVVVDTTLVLPEGLSLPGRDRVIADVLALGGRGALLPADFLSK